MLSHLCQVCEPQKEKLDSGAGPGALQGLFSRKGRAGYTGETGCLGRESEAPPPFCSGSDGPRRPRSRLSCSLTSRSPSLPPSTHHQVLSILIQAHFKCLPFLDLSCPHPSSGHSASLYVSPYSSSRSHFFLPTLHPKQSSDLLKK